MELHVEATGIAHRLALSITTPQRGGGSLAVGTREAYPAGSRLQHKKGSVLCLAGLGQNSPSGTPGLALAPSLGI